MSLAVDRGGARSPELAAARFVRTGSPPGYGTLSTVWSRESETANGVTLRVAHVWLDVVRLHDGTWAVDSGGRCL
jgi:hypothetical protein